MRNLILILSVISLISCQKENINPAGTPTVVNISTKHGVTNLPLDGFNCALIQTQHEVVNEDKVLSTATTVNGLASLQFTHNSWNDYDVEVDAGDLILLNQRIPSPDLGVSNHMDLLYSEKAHLQLDVTNSNQGTNDGQVWIRILYENYPTYKLKNIPFEGFTRNSMPGSITYIDLEIPSGNYTIEWDIMNNGLQTAGSETITIDPYENEVYEVNY